MARTWKPRPVDIPDGPFVAIDFETANWSRESACAVALIRVEDGQVVDRKACLIRPPSSTFQFTYIHGIAWRDVAREPDFADCWRTLMPMLDGAQFLAAHNAGFDRNVLQACCRRACLPMPPQRFVCTMALARKVWNLWPTKLPDVCRFLKLPLKHHDAESDALACAGIVIAAKSTLPVATTGLFAKS